MKIASRLSYVTDWGKRGLKKIVIHIMTKVAMQASPRPTAKPWMKLLFCLGFFWSGLVGGSAIGSLCSGSSGAKSSCGGLSSLVSSS